MAEYIEKGKLIDALYGNDCITFQGLKIIHELPVFERKHGRWINKGGLMRCTYCGSSPDDSIYISTNQYRYCPKCGADMRGE